MFCLRNSDRNKCCLCGGINKLTGEHKIKASLLRKEFGRSSPLIIKSSDSFTKPKNAQSPKSDYFKFTAKICELCNTSRTQEADREFDRFCSFVSDKQNQGESLDSVFDLSLYQRDSDAYLNVFRYFAKLLCCHMAEVCAPIPKKIADFAIGISSINYIWLDIKSDETYNQIYSIIGETEFAAHGGLIVYGDISGAANAFHSSLTIGKVQYVFFSRLSLVEKIEIQLLYPKFYKWCKSQITYAKNNPLTTDTKKRLGL